jgi:single-strand DNA-binding protein
LTKDPEKRQANSGLSITTFTVAADRPVREGKEKEADFLPVVTFDRQADNCAQYLVKGSMVAVEGRIQTRNYENKDGNKVYVTEIVANNVKFLSPKPDSQYTQSQAQTSAPRAFAGSASSSSSNPFIQEDFI